MEYIILFTIIFSFAVTFTIILQRRFEQVLPISIVSIALIIYISGMFDNLALGTTIVNVLTILGLIFFIFIVIKKDSEKKLKEMVNNIFTPGFLIYVLLFGASIFFSKNRIFEEYDEFNHWAVIIKNMFIYNTYGTNAESIVTFNDYPPFTAIFQFLFLSVQKIYREDIIIMAQNVLYFSIIIPITKNLKWNFKGWVKSILLIVFMPMIFFENFYLEILVDGMLGVMFAYTIYSSYEKEQTKQKYLNILAGLIMLALTKTTGIALAILAILIIVVKSIASYRKNKQEASKEIKLILICSLIISLLTGMWYIKVNHAEKTWNLEKINTDNMDRDESNVTKSFIKTLFTEQNITDKKITVVETICLFGVIILLMDDKLKENDYRYYSIAMLICIPIYLIGMLLIYLKLFDPGEAIILACFERYISTILLAIVAFQAYVIEDKNHENNYKQSLVIIFIIVAMLPISNIEEKYIEGKAYIRKSVLVRNMNTELKNYKSQLNDEDKILYLIDMISKKLQLQKINSYEMMPIKIQDVMLGSFKSLEKFEDLVSNYTHVFIYKIEQQENDIIKYVFEDQNIIDNTMYKVIKTDESIFLERLKIEK